MTLVPNSEGQKINWINYKTGVKHIYFRMEVDNKYAYIYIEISHPDKDLRELMYEQFLTYQTVLHQELAEQWIWDPVYYDIHGKETARISMHLDEKISVFKPEDWPTLISFFKPRIIALDAFWSTAKYGFEIFK